MHEQLRREPVAPRSPLERELADALAQRTEPYRERLVSDFALVAALLRVGQGRAAAGVLGGLQEAFVAYRTELADDVADAVVAREAEALIARSRLSAPRIEAETAPVRPTMARLGTTSRKHRTARAGVRRDRAVGVGILSAAALGLVLTLTLPPILHDQLKISEGRDESETRVGARLFSGAVGVRRRTP